MLQQIIYTSKVHPDHDNLKSLEDILKKARTNNTKLGVTGLLVLDKGTFLQVLEGEEKALQFLYTKIEKDPRHSNLRLLLKQDIKEKEFGDWSMAFGDLEDNINILEGHMSLTELEFANITAPMAKKVLQQFFMGCWQT